MCKGRVELKGESFFHTRLFGFEIYWQQIKYHYHANGSRKRIYQKLNSNISCKYLVGEQKNTIKQFQKFSLI